MAKIGSYVFLLISLFSPLVGAADEIKVQAVVDRNEVAVGESFVFTVSVSSSSNFSGVEPRLPDLSGFELLRTWEGRSTRSTFVNGQFSSIQSIEFNYLLAAQKKGISRIGAVEVNLDGKVYKTAPIEVSVGDASQGQIQRHGGTAQQNPFGDDEEEDLFSLLLKQRGMVMPFGGQPAAPGRAVNPSEAFFIDVEVSKDKVYVGEGITASYYLYTRGNITEIDTLKHPDLQGFLREDIEVAQRLSFSGAVVNGVQYNKALLASYAIFPMKEGRLTVDPYKAKCTVLLPSGIGFGRPYRYTKASRPVKIQVMPLPTEGRPADFTGIIGNFQVSAHLEKTSVPVNQPVSLKVRFEGSSGNAKVIELPHLDLPSSVELYDTKSDAKFFRNGNTYKEFEVLLIPREVGPLTIPPLNFSIFNPITEKYELKSTPAQQLQVVAGDGSQVIASNPLDTSLATAGDDKATGALRLPGLVMGLPSSHALSVAQLAGVWGAIYLLIFGLLAWRARLVLGWGQKQMTLQKQVVQRFRSIHKAAEKGDWRRVGVELSNAIYFALGALSEEKLGSQEMEKILESAPPSVRRQLGDELRSTMDVAQTLGFAPESLVGELKNKDVLRKQVKRAEGLLLKAVAIEP